MTENAETRARELLVWGDCLEEVGLADVAGRSRACARDVLDLLPTLEAERSARRALQERCDELQAVVGKGAYFLCIAEAAHDAAATVLAKKEQARMQRADPLAPIEWPDGPDNVVPIARGRGA